MDNLEKKFAKLYDEHLVKIYRFVFLKVDSQETAEDLTAKVFVKSWKRFQMDDDIKNPSAYFFQLARTVIADHYREETKLQVISIENISLKDNSLNPEESHQTQSDLAVLTEKLKQLDDDYQNVLIMRYLDDLPVKTIAQVLEKPEGTVRVMVHRGLKQLKEKMADTLDPQIVNSANN